MYTHIIEDPSPNMEAATKETINRINTGINGNICKHRSYRERDRECNDYK